MIKIPAEKLANAVIKHLLPGLIRHLSDQKKEATEHKKKTEKGLRSDNNENI